MSSLQSASDVNFSIFSSEQLEDDFITNLFSQNIHCSETTSTLAYQNVVPKDSWLSTNQMDHDNVAYTEPSTLLSPTWEEPSTTRNTSSSLNMSTYFSTFDPSAQFQPCQHQFPVNQNKLNSIHQHIMGKKHQAGKHLVPTGSGQIKAIVKRKRKRTVFRTDQVEAMEKVFNEKPYVTKEDRKALVDTLQISDKSVKVWFQNRRLKNKRGDDQCFSEEENRSSPGFDRLDHLESKIHERTNEFGYVTLDDSIMNDLVQVIDDYMHKPKADISTRDIKMEVADISMQESKVKFDSIPEYEPISPASTTDYSNEESSWECQSPVGYKYLQRLIDIESIISK